MSSRILPDERVAANDSAELDFNRLQCCLLHLAAAFTVRSPEEGSTWQPLFQEIHSLHSVTFAENAEWCDQVIEHHRATEKRRAQHRLKQVSSASEWSLQPLASKEHWPTSGKLLKCIGCVVEFENVFVARTEDDLNSVSVEHFPLPLSISVNKASVLCKFE